MLYMKPEALTDCLPGIYRAVAKVPINGPMSMMAAMHVIKTNDALILVDPCRLPDSDLKTLEDLGTPTHIIITCSNHVRHTQFYRDRYKTPVLANRALVSKIETGVDTFFGDGDALPGGLSGIDMPGMSPGETILLHSGGKGALIVGDAIFNYQKGDFALPMKLFSAIGMLPKGLSPMPGFAMENKAEAAKSSRKLLDYTFDAIFVSHGSPFLSGAKAKWQEVVA
jgi:glyoxylase-like metal-dependent hydrolase (beta-lactamase superfamily II)